MAAERILWTEAIVNAAGPFGEAVNVRVHDDRYEIQDDDEKLSVRWLSEEVAAPLVSSGGCHSKKKGENELLAPIIIDSSTLQRHLITFQVPQVLMVLQPLILIENFLCFRNSVRDDFHKGEPSFIH